MASEFVGGGLSLYTSTDLVNWKGPASIPGFDQPLTRENWQSAPMLYTIFMDKDGRSSNEIDANEFFLVGAHGSARRYNRIRLGVIVDPR